MRSDQNCLIWIYFVPVNVCSQLILFGRDLFCMKTIIRADYCHNYDLTLRHSFYFILQQHTPNQLVKHLV